MVVKQNNYRGIKMESYISSELGLNFPPIVLLKSDEKPEDAKGPKAGKGGCVMSFVAQTIAKRVTTYFHKSLQNQTFYFIEILRY